MCIVTLLGKFLFSSKKVIVHESELCQITTPAVNSGLKYGLIVHLNSFLSVRETKALTELCGYVGAAHIM